MMRLYLVDEICKIAFLFYNFKKKGSQIFSFKAFVFTINRCYDLCFYALVANAISINSKELRNSFSLLWLIFYLLVGRGQMINLQIFKIAKL